MQEAFLHYVWQYQYFNRQGLKTAGGDDVLVIRPGLLNTHAGPDFADAKVRIGDIDWAGSIEIHIRSSDWKNHHHDIDNAYDSVILHVVWEDDRPVVRADATILPAVELRHRVPVDLVHQYKRLVNSGFRIPCERSLLSVPEVIRNNMLDRAMVERLEEKSGEVRALLKLNNGDWEESAYQLLAKNFGFKVNADPFFQLARNLPYRFLRKHVDRPAQVEAMLFGVAGFLAEKVGSDYHRELRREYQLLRVKYQLHRSELHASQWKFLRLRPANFPSRRLAQFAALIVHQKNISSQIINTQNAEQLRKMLAVPLSTFWDTHYTFRKRARRPVGGFGEFSIDNIVINSIAPYLAAYGKYKDDAQYIERAELLLREANAETNTVIKHWRDAGWMVKNAFDSQALIQLFNSYCIPRQCLNCSIGATLLKPGECFSGSPR